MKTANKLRLLGMLACCLIGQSIFAQSPIVKDIDVQADQTQLTMNETAASTYLVQISGPNAYHTQFEVANTSDIRLSPQKADGTAFSNGSYKVSITPTFQLSAEHQQNMMEMRQKGDTEAINQYLIDHQLPTSLDVYTINFGVQDGKFVAPGRHEGDMPPPTMFGKRTDFSSSDAIYASVNYFETDLYAQTIDNSLLEEEDMQVFATDVIVQGSLCVGIDCNSSESFGFDTQRFKENNLRVHFDDTSASASFPSNDWRITINDSDNGGSNYFAVQDATGGTTPFRVEAGAGNNALHVDASGGNIGMGTASPVVELHVTDGDSPTMRLEQNGSSGFTSQTWDIAGNETNFFVRDVTNGSKLPFKIKPGAPDNSLFVAANGDIGLGTQTPSEALHVKSGNVRVEAGNLTMDAGNATINGNTIINGNARYALTNRANFLGAGNATVLQVDGINNRVGIGKGSPDHLLELAADDAVKPGGGSWSAPSDRRLKTGIKDFEDGLAQVMAIRPVRYHYNGKMDMPTDQEFIGLIAQEVREVAPYTVKVTEGSEEGYLFVDGTPLTYILINAVQEQQAIIDNQDERINELEAQLSEVAQLRQEVAELAKVLKAQVTEQNADTQSQNVSEKR
ncbi:tail fiber domain-containing protein [Lewinella cohaerens]|uniref:tail fiber domain-containing protein n=1 Tax=Lewinella cohaerens TaxID=70995 RepID=UPI0003789372|nr:tail fiber domain-containing protein [Lewinella cohaerens]